MALPGLRGLPLFGVLKRALADFSRDSMTIYASALAYRALFSLFPFLIFLVALLGFLNLPQLFDWLRGQASLVVPGDGMQVVDRVLDEVRSANRGLLSLGILLALYSASAGVATAMEALNVAYDVRERRPALKRYVLALAYTVGIAVLLILAAGLMVIGPGIAEWIAARLGLQDLVIALWTWLRWPVAVLLLMLAASLVYYAGPNAPIRYRLVTPGAVLAVAVWIVASLGFGYYVRTIGNYNATYGSLGAVVILLFYFFLSAAVFLFGAEINAVIERSAAKPTASRGPAAAGTPLATKS
jgi:membrane protein